uniref:Uncharacterized protein n=1 Tax=Romanomermis culicivorax TaxID=13658 RepID=A0A915JZW3_ROMCU
MTAENSHCFFNCDSSQSSDETTKIGTIVNKIVLHLIDKFHFQSILFIFELRVYPIPKKYEDSFNEIGTRSFFKTETIELKKTESKILDCISRFSKNLYSLENDNQYVCCDNTICYLTERCLCYKYDYK